MAERTDEQLMQDLKQKADKLGVTYSPNIGFETLKGRVSRKLAALEEEKTSDDAIAKAKKEAMKPWLCIVHDLDPLYQSEPTIPYTVGNKHFKIGCIIKKEVEQLIPKSVVIGLQGKTMIQWKDQIHNITKRPTGNKIAYTTKRYNIEILNKNPKI